MAEMDAYNEAVESGQYQKPTGLLGKYDNVRRFWEDEQVGLYLRPFIKDTAHSRSQRGSSIRVLDIGCGGGDGLEVIRIATEQPAETYFYKGIDMNEGLLRQAESIFNNKPNLHFVQSDYNDFDYAADEPYDLYLANYGTLSHNTDDKTARLLAKIARFGNDGAIICVDWLGRYAYEWQTLWTNDHDNNQWMDYIISYIYSDDQAEKPSDLTAFPLRIMGRSEVMSIFDSANELCEGALVLRELSDRSSFVGRHQDTAQYNRHCRPLRCVVNRLFEPGISTDLDELVIDYHTMDGFDDINEYHTELVNSWNHLALHTKALVEREPIPPMPEDAPSVLMSTIVAMDRIIDAASSITIGNPRACLIEPQLGYCLRELEMELQRGQGCGHGLVAVFEVVKHS